MTQKDKIKYSLVAVISTALSGCSLFEAGMSHQTAKNPCAVVQNSEGDCAGTAADKTKVRHPIILPSSTNSEVASTFNTPIHFQMLNDYVEQMAIDLSRDLLDLTLQHPIAVTSFVQLDASLNNADSLGNQLAENFITELRKVGLLVNDHKVTGNIAVSSTGDFALSRDNKQLKPIQNIGYVLTGTMVKNSKGMLVNARIVGLSSNVVVAATSKLIPNILLQEYQ